MNKTFAFAALLACLTFAGCTTKPLLDLPDVAVTSQHTPEEVRLAIIAAATTLGWQTKDVEPGLLRATLHLRTHTAESDIAYSAAKYSITYVASTDLDYKDGKIHGNYNRWIANLSQAIQAQLNSK